MGIVIVVVCLGAGLNLALWVALYSKLAELPQRVWKAVERAREVDQQRALTALQEAAAAKVGMLVLGLRSYHDQLEGHLKAQVAEAEVRARVAERRSSDAGVALGAASALVAELRGLAEDLPRLLARGAQLARGRGLAHAPTRARPDRRRGEPNDRRDPTRPWRGRHDPEDGRTGAGIAGAPLTTRPRDSCARGRRARGGDDTSGTASTSRCPHPRLRGDHPERSRRCSVTSDISTPIDEDVLARIDVLARLHGVTRDQMIARIMRTGLLHEERQAQEAQIRGNGGAS